MTRRKVTITADKRIATKLDTPIQSEIVCILFNENKLPTNSQDKNIRIASDVYYNDERIGGIVNLGDL